MHQQKNLKELGLPKRKGSLQRHKVRNELGQLVRRKRDQEEREATGDGITGCENAGFQKERVISKLIPRVKVGLKERGTLDRPGSIH